MSNMPKIGDILNFFGDRNVKQLAGFHYDIIIRRPATISDAQPGEISFCDVAANDPEKLLAQTNASLLIVDKNISIEKVTLSDSGVKAIMLSDNARLDFIRVVERFFGKKKPMGIHSSAVIAPSALIGSNVFIGPLCTIGENVEIGEGTVIHAGVHIYNQVSIGRDVIINSGTVIGADGFGYENNKEGRWEKFPHVGGVIIEDDIEIGANTCIDRGTLGNTHICQGVRIDNLVHVAHNVIIGKHAVVIANVMIGGGTRIGNYSWIAPSACLRDRISIGNKSTVGMASVVTKDIPNGETWVGVPARPINEFKKFQQKLKKL